MKNHSKETIWIAALLHDLGKFQQRAEPSIGVSHQEYARRFVVDIFGNYFKGLHPDLESVIANHHESELTTRIQKIIVIADRLSMREGAAETDFTQSPPWEPLSALLTCQPIAPTAGVRKRISLQTLPLQTTDMFPIELCPDEDAFYKKLSEQFQMEFSRFVNNREFESHDIVTIMSLLHKYLTCMPAQTVSWQRMPEDEKTPLDTSLFLHLKTTAAIAACLNEQLTDAEIDALLREDKEMSKRPLCALVKGDISGTQDFLYLLSSDGAARGLKARSFYLQLLNDTIAQWILRQTGLSEINLLYVGGGHFYLLLPFEKTSKSIERWRERISEILWHGHQGDLYLNLGYVPVASEDFLQSESGDESRFAQKWAEVNIEISLQKQRKWLGAGEAGMISSHFTPQEVGGAEARCDVCQFEGNLEIDNETLKCQRCRAFEELGKALRNPKYMISVQRPEKKKLPMNPAWPDILAAFGTEIMVGASRKKRRVSSKTATLWNFDDANVWPTDKENAAVIEAALIDFTWDKPPQRRDIRLFAGATPSKIDKDTEKVVVAEFGDLAEASDGAKFLGVLRMDVDSLGQVFESRLGARANMARICEMSESLRLFFESRVPQICRERNRFSLSNQDEKDRLFLVYAGGDDLFLVGAWSELPIIARKIRDEFRLFVGGDHLTISAGIAIEHEKYPLYQLANDAKHALDDRAKEYRRKGNNHDKDAICFLQSTVGWEDFENLKSWTENLVQMIEGENGKPKLPHGFLTRLGEIHSLLAENRKSKLHLQHQSGSLQSIEEMIYYDKWRWHLTYQLGRVAERFKDHASIIKDLQNEIIEQRLVDNLNVIARWAELTTRKE
jgi:CRISPR-associated protein Csm1